MAMEVEAEQENMSSRRTSGRRVVPSFRLQRFQSVVERFYRYIWNNGKAARSYARRGRQWL